tara:strand:+ start:57 stop:362 length:306 start_codon:yes stop_codon:yes gene_type:complete
MLTKEQKKLANHNHYMVHRAKILAKAKVKRDAMTPEKKQALKDYRNKYVSLNRAKVYASTARWRAKNKDKIKEAQKKYKENATQRETQEQVQQAPAHRVQI